MSALSRLDPALAAPTPVDRATAPHLSRATRAKDQGSYRNALRSLPRLLDAMYVKGVVVVDNGLQFDHAWRETASGVVDPTPIYAAMEDGACIYVAGPRWSLGEIRVLFSQEESAIVTPIFPLDSTKDPRRDAWIVAKLAAFRHV